MAGARLPNEWDMEGVSPRHSRRHSAPVTPHEIEQSVAGSKIGVEASSDGTVGEMHDANTQSTLRLNGSEHTRDYHDGFRRRLRGFGRLEPSNIRAEYFLGGEHGFALPVRAGTRFLSRLPDVDLIDFPNETNCNICMEHFGDTEDSESPVQLPCHHVVGRNCISRWLETKNSCPFCRHVLFEPEEITEAERDAHAEVLDFVAELREIVQEESAIATRLDNLERGNVRMSNSERNREVSRINLDSHNLEMRMQLLVAPF